MKKIFIPCLILLISLLFTNCQKSDVKHIVLNKGPHLFIDDYLIAEQTFLNRTVNNPEKLPEPILVAGRKNDYVWQPYFSVLRDPESGRFRMWYNVPVSEKNTGRCLLGYIESEDGINWIRPHKVLEIAHEIQFGASVIDRGLDFENKEERYVFATHLKPGLYISTSADGLNWKPISDGPVLYHNHDISSLFWDPIRKQYFAIVSHRLNGFSNPTQPNIDDKRRTVHQSISKDLKDWEEVWPICLPKNGVPIEKGETQFYAMSGVITRGDLMIGLVKVLRDDLNATPGKSAKQMGDKKRKAAGIGYTVLAWTRDGITWQRDHEPFLDRNHKPGTFDHAMAWGDEQIIVDDKVYIYYGGYERGHKIERFNERHLGFASMLKDRYVSRDADFNGGRLLTKPLVLNGEKIIVNANIIGECKVRIVDTDGKTLPGFDWIKLRGDSINHELNWEKELSAISGKTFCLEFRLKDAQLFGFEVK